MDWELLKSDSHFDLRRSGRFLIADLKGPHLVLSTSARLGGQTGEVRHLLNHQSCEAAAHHDRHRLVVEGGPEAYHDRVCAEADLPAGATAVMGTAANMNYAAIEQESDEGLTVTAVVTGGVEGNATAPGEPAAWRETAAGIEKVPVFA